MLFPLQLDNISFFSKKLHELYFLNFIVKQEEIHCAAGADGFSGHQSSKQRFCDQPLDGLFEDVKITFKGEANPANNKIAI
jgi:hypothetical protein